MDAGNTTAAQKRLDRFFALVREYSRDAEVVWKEVLARARVDNLEEWRESGLPLRGRLPGNPPLSYRFHSERPELLIRLEDGREIDLIFHKGKLGAFDVWRLQHYATSYSNRFPEYNDERLLHEDCAEAERAGLIKATEWLGVFVLGAPSRP